MKYNIIVGTCSQEDTCMMIKYHLENVEVKEISWSPVFEHSYSDELEKALYASLAWWKRVEIKKAAAIEIKKRFNKDYDHNQLSLIDFDYSEK